jgi:large subunit ribosomal protein L23
MNLHQVILKPVVTEKSSSAAAAGKYTFVVNKKATKIDVKNAIRTLYGVNVTKVNIIQTPRKIRLVGRGREIEKRQAVKKATITLTAGSKIDVYKFQSTKKN